MQRINYINEYLKNKFGERVLKICVDGNFTCPNRDGKCGKGGCIFCGERGSGEHLTSANSLALDEVCENISKQVQKYLNSYRAERANKFIVYFQNFTNTYDTLENLKAKYDSALIDERIVGLSIATRPDCINEEIVKLISSYSNKYFVTVELGLQTSNDEVAEKINRGYRSAEFTKAVEILNKYSIDVVAHVMVGLPSEDTQQIKETVKFFNAHKLQGIKIHSTYIIKKTKLAEMYSKGEYTPITLEYYLETLSYILTHISPEIVVHRISGDAPKEMLVAPDWNLHKKWVLNGIEKKFKAENLYQGKYYSSTNNSLPTPQIGQTQSSGKSQNLTPSTASS